MGALRYEEVPDAATAATALCTAGLLTAGRWAERHGRPTDSLGAHPPSNQPADKGPGPDSPSAKKVPTLHSSVTEVSAEARAALADVVQVLTVPELLQLAPVLGFVATGGRDALLDGARRAIKHRHTPSQVGSMWCTW